MYADPIIDVIEKKRKFFSRRYYRGDLSKSPEFGGDIKDIERLGFDLRRTIIIDNYPENFIRQKDNGIYVKAFVDDESDTMLLDLIPVLVALAKS